MGFLSSTGVRNSLLAKLKVELDLGKIYIYETGAGIPASANDDITGYSSNLLLTISTDGGATGLSFDSPSNGLMFKATGDIWTGDVAKGGTPTWYRFKANSDDDSSSTTICRLQGTVGTLGTDIVLANATLVITEPQILNYYVVGLPESS